MSVFNSESSHRATAIVESVFTIHIENIMTNPPSQGTPPTITANMLRALAEAAEAFRGRNAALVHNPENTTHPYSVVADPTGNRPDALIRLRTDDDPPFATRDHPLTLSTIPAVRFSNLGSKTLADCDALFLSLAAVDKFVVPYYAGMRDLAEVKRRRDEFATNGKLLAMAHLPDSVDVTLQAIGNGPIYMLSADSKPAEHTQQIKLIPFL